MNENQKMQMRQAVERAHETCCDASGRPSHEYTMQHGENMMNKHPNEHMRMSKKAGDRNEIEDKKMYDY